MVEVSIIMPLARVDDFFLKTLKSVFGQTYNNYELIIVCPKEIESLAHDAVTAIGLEKKTLIISTALSGVAFASNLCIAASSGKYIARWDSDDLCEKSRLEAQVDYLNKNPEVVVLGTRAVIIDENDQPVSNHHFKFFERDRDIRRALKYRQPLLHSSLMFRREVLFNVKGYLFGHTSEDHEMFIRIARDKKIKFYNLPNVITSYRRYPNQLSDFSRRKIAFAEISSFLFCEFILTKDLTYILGMIANHHFSRSFRRFWRNFNPR
jgi:glycosyltransferase involved in cell wall biosynthesis